MFNSTKVIESPDEPLQMDDFNQSGHLSTTVLPIAQIGHGNSGVEGKFEGVFSSVKLDVSWQPNSCTISMAKSEFQKEKKENKTLTVTVKVKLLKNCAVPTFTVTIVQLG